MKYIKPVTVALRMTITFRIFCNVFPRILVNIGIYFFTEYDYLYSFVFHEMARIKMQLIEQKNVDSSLKICFSQNSIHFFVTSPLSSQQHWLTMVFNHNRNVYQENHGISIQRNFSLFHLFI